MHPSFFPLSLFLKLPATILATSPSASDTCSTAFSGGKSSMRAAMRSAARCPQRTLTTPQISPANPTIAANAVPGCECDSCPASSSLPSIRLKTSLVPISRNEYISSWLRTLGSDWMVSVMPVRLQQRQDVLLHLVGSKRLADIALRSHRERLHHVRFAAFGRDHDHRHASRILHVFQPLHELQSIHDRHVDVAQNQINSGLRQHGQRLRPISRLAQLRKLHARLSQCAFDNLPHDRRVIHDQRAHALHNGVGGLARKPPLSISEAHFP